MTAIGSALGLQSSIEASKICHRHRAFKPTVFACDQTGFIDHQSATWNRMQRLWRADAAIAAKGHAIVDQRGGD
jgi:hypothetical protein